MGMEDFTSIRVTKKFILQLDMKRMQLQSEGKIDQMTKEEFIEYLLKSYEANEK